MQPSANICRGLSMAQRSTRDKSAEPLARVGVLLEKHFSALTSFAHVVLRRLVF